MRFILNIFFKTTSSMTLWLLCHIRGTGCWCSISVTLMYTWTRWGIQQGKGWVSELFSKAQGPLCAVPVEVTRLSYVSLTSLPQVHLCCLWATWWNHTLTPKSLFSLPSLEIRSLPFEWTQLHCSLSQAPRRKSRVCLNFLIQNTKSRSWWTV